jgi:hypothetical protein
MPVEARRAESEFKMFKKVLKLSFMRDRGFLNSASMSINRVGDRGEFHARDSRIV